MAFLALPKVSRNEVESVYVSVPGGETHEFAVRVLHHRLFFCYRQTVMPSASEIPSGITFFKENTVLEICGLLTLHILFFTNGEDI